jgi:diadenosine tetraphosphate (Ap4A) HIT family hydrolase
MDDSNYPCWLVLVPRINNIIEITDITDPKDRAQMWKEVELATAVIQKLFQNSSGAAGAAGGLSSFKKLNIAIIGNIVSQLHIHITARLESDPSWPGPCYGAVPAKAFTEDECSALVGRLRGGFESEE